jgi:hypothetical protein
MTSFVLVLLAQNLNQGVPTVRLPDGGLRVAAFVEGSGLGGGGVGAITIVGGAAIPTCSAGQVVTADGGVFSCVTPAGGSGGAPVDGGYVVWSSVGSTNERVLSAGNYTVVDTGTAGQAQVDWTHGLSCSAGQALTTSGSTAMVCTSTLTASDLVCSGTCVGDAEIAAVSGAKVSGAVATATALAANPTACTAGQYVSDIAADGALTCGTPAGTYVLPDATSSVTGGVRLTGDLGGTATSPTVVDDSHAHTGATISGLDTGDVTTGTLGQARGGTGSGVLTCAADERLTSNGTTYSCSTLPASSGGTSPYVLSFGGF